MGVQGNGRGIKNESEDGLDLLPTAPRSGDGEDDLNIPTSNPSLPLHMGSYSGEGVDTRRRHLPLPQCRHVGSFPSRLPGGLFFWWMPVPTTVRCICKPRQQAGSLPWHPFIGAGKAACFIRSIAWEDQKAVSLLQEPPTTWGPTPPHTDIVFLIDLHKVAEQRHGQIKQDEQGDVVYIYYLCTCLVLIVQSTC